MVCLLSVIAVYLDKVGIGIDEDICVLFEGES